MIPAQEAYDFIEAIILSCKTSFHFSAADALIELFGKKFPEHHEKKIMLIDLRADVHHEIFNNDRNKIHP